MSRAFGPRRAAWVEVDSTDDGIASSESLEIMTRFDLIYRSIVATQFNFHQSGHPGGSISVGHVLTALLFGTMDVPPCPHTRPLGAPPGSICPFLPHPKTADC